MIGVTKGLLDLTTPAATPMKSRRRAGLNGRLPDTFRWGVYLRISDDRTGEEKGVGRQETDGRERVSQRGGTVVKVYAENDTSAYKKRKIKLRDEEGNEYVAYRVIRPIFQQMIRDLRNGVIDGAMVYDLDRLARDPRDLEDCVEMVEHFGRIVESTTPGQVDLTNSNGIAMARVIIAMANKSSADTARRVERAHYELALQGASVGGPRPFGWNEDRKSLNEVEAAMIRNAVERLVVGEKLHVIGAEWNAGEVRTPRGRQWRRSTMVEILTNPRLCGLRTYHDEVMIGRDGKPVRGQWTPIVTEAQLMRAREILVRRSMRGDQPRHPGGRNRVYTWSGILRCGKPTGDGGICGTRMHGYPRPKNHSAGFSYACRPKSDSGCGALSVSGLHVDEIIGELVMQAIEDAHVSGRIGVRSETWIHAEDLSKAEGRLRELGEMYAAGDLDKAEYLHLRETVKSTVQVLQQQRSEWFATQVRMEQATEDIRETWKDLSIYQKQEAARTAGLEAVIVSPAKGRGGHKFDPDRLQPVWV